MPDNPYRSTHAEQPHGNKGGLITIIAFVICMILLVAGGFLSFRLFSNSPSSPPAIEPAPPPPPIERDAGH